MRIGSPPPVFLVVVTFTPVESGAEASALGPYPA
jgi:hypothetical protein